jgi:O-acetyl-ADP-ribose deacetylase
MVNKVTADITKVPADVIINAANTELIHGGGVAAAIAKAAGEKLIDECKQIKRVPLGSFAITCGGNLPCKAVIHIPTIDYFDSENPEAITYEDLKKVWESVLYFCALNKIKSIATPLLGTGVAGLQKDKVENILTSVAEKFTDFEITIVSRQPVLT